MTAVMDLFSKTLFYGHHHQNKKTAGLISHKNRERPEAR
jgi:hypothetical protein